MNDYQIAIYDPYEIPVDILTMSRILRLSYELVVNGISTLTLTLKSDDNLNAILSPQSSVDYIFDLYRDNGSGLVLEKSFFFRGANLEEDPQTGALNLVCVADSPENLLEARQIIPEDDPVNAGGFITRGGASDAVMMDFVNYQCIAPALYPERVIPRLRLATFSGLMNPTYQRRKHEDKLLDILVDIAKQSFTDFWITHEAGEFVFHAGRLGTDRSVTTNYPVSDYTLFSPLRGNIANPRLSWNRQKEITWVYVAGQGVDETRFYLPVGSGRALDSPFNRRESTIDARTDETLDELASQGNAELNRSQPRMEFSCTILTNASGARYNDDWYLGDVVTMKWLNFQADYRVTAVKIDVTESEESIVPTLHTPPFGG